MLSIGLMSGTSMDGINAALIETDGGARIQEIDHLEIPYDHHFKVSLRTAERCVRELQGNIEKALFCDPFLRDVITHLTYLHGESVFKLLERTSYKAHEIEVVGFHGQTLFHRPDLKISLSVGDGQALADQVGIKVVNNFRAQDIAAGGQGAPFAPLYHQALAQRDRKIPCAVLNCGGIANITFVFGPYESDIIAFDTGPGNGLIDRWVSHHTHHKEFMDLDGRYGREGSADENILQALYEKSIRRENQNYFLRPAPKSLDIGDLNLIPELDKLSMEDACRTLEAFTSETIVRSLDLVNIKLPSTWILAGGGWYNPVIRQEFEERLSKKLGDHLDILTADEVGWTIQGMEAQVFAYLAVRSLQNKFLSVPSTTGVSYPISGGTMYVPKTSAI